MLEREGGGLEGDHLLALDLEHRRELRRAVQGLQRDDDGHVLHQVFDEDAAENENERGKTKRSEQAREIALLREALADAQAAAAVEARQLPLQMIHKLCRCIDGNRCVGRRAVEHDRVRRVLVVLAHLWSIKGKEGRAVVDDDARAALQLTDVVGLVENLADLVALQVVDVLLGRQTPDAHHAQCGYESLTVARRTLKVFNPAKHEAIAELGHHGLRERAPLKLCGLTTFGHGHRQPRPPTTTGGLALAGDAHAAKLVCCQCRRRRFASRL